MMVITLDNLAHRYSCLPSEVLRRGSTFDLYVLDVSTKWSNYQQDKADGRQPIARQPTQAEMFEMIKKARGQ